MFLREVGPILVASTSGVGSGGELAWVYRRQRKSVDCQYAGLYRVSCSAMPCRCALRCVATRMALWLLFGLWLSFGPLCWHLITGLSFGLRLAALVVVWPFSLLFGALLWALG